MRGNGLKLCQGRVRLGIRGGKNHWKSDLHWNKFPGEVLESPSLEMFKRHPHVALAQYSLEVIMVVLR